MKLLEAPGSVEVKTPGQAAHELPAELADLAGLAAAADAQLAGVDQVPGAPGADQAAAELEANEHASITGALCLLANIGSKAVPPIGDAYTPEACGTIATEYLRCAELYGWTFHRAASNPILGLVAAAALPAVMHLEAFKAHFAQRKDAAAAAAREPAPLAQPLPPIDTEAPRSHAGTRIG
jgi:hypothetical protein